jgi:hypothetical protein
MSNDYWSDSDISSEANNYQPITPVPSTMNRISTIGSGAVEGAATGTTVAPGWGTAIGAVVGALMSWYGMKKQEEQANNSIVYNEKMANRELEERAKDRAIQTDQFNKNIDLNREQMLLSKKQAKENLDFQKSEAAKTWAWKEDDENFTRTQALSNRLLGIFNSAPQLKQGFLQNSIQKKQSTYDFSPINPIPR